MTRRKRTGPAYKRGRSFRMILPPDISARIEKEARDEGRPQSRVIVNHLARIPDLDAQAPLDELVRELRSILAEREARASVSGLDEELRRAVDALLETPAEGAAGSAARERLRVARLAMLEVERRTTQIEREQLAIRTTVLERRIAVQRVELGAGAEPERAQAAKPARRTQVTA